MENVRVCATGWPPIFSSYLFSPEMGGQPVAPCKDFKSLTVNRSVAKSSPRYCRPIFAVSHLKKIGTTR